MLNIEPGYFCESSAAVMDKKLLNDRNRTSPQKFSSTGGTSYTIRKLPKPFGKKLKKVNLRNISWIEFRYEYNSAFAYSL